MGSSGGQTPVTQQTTQTKDPWSSAQPYLQNIMGYANNLYSGGQGYLPYGGQTVAQLNEGMNQGISAGYGLAASEPQGSSALNNARGLMDTMVQNQGINAGLQNSLNQYGDIYSRAQGNENPYLQGVINQQMDKVNSAMSGAGRYGSGSHEAGIAQAIAPTLAQDYMQRQQLQMAATGAQSDIYGQGLQRAGQAAQLIPSLDEARFSNANKMLGYADLQRQSEQQNMDAALKLWNAQQGREWEQLARFNAIVGGAGGLGGTQVTTAPGATQPGTLQRVLGGGLAGAGIGGSIFGAPGAAVGAGAGGLLGML